MTVAEAFLHLVPDDIDGAEQVVLASLAESGKVSPDLLRTLARMQTDPAAFFMRIDALLTELDADVAQAD